MNMAAVILMVLWISAAVHAVFVAFCFLGLNAIIVGAVWIILGLLLLFFGWVAAKTPGADTMHAAV